MVMHAARQARWAGPVLALAVSAACGGPSATPASTVAAPPTGTAQLKPEYDQTGKLTKIEYDRNNDGKPDAWGYMDGSRVVRVEVDENGDGQVDRWEFHRPDAAPGAPVAGVDATVERIERATKFDGKVNRKEFFDKGALVRVEEDTDGDGRTDKWETYENGSLRMTALDTSGRGTADRRLLYNADGSFDHIEADPSDSGTFTPVKP